MVHFIGTAGWTVPKQNDQDFPADGSHLQRYSRSLNAVEINSSFYRPHQPKTYQRWAEETDANLRFCVKMTKVFTHEKRLEAESDEIEQWLEPVKNLGEKLGSILVQIPPKLEFETEIANEFFKNLREHYDGLIAFEPRHISWTTKHAQNLYDVFKVTKVEADPERCPLEPDRRRPRYIRLHGSPEIYRSDYEPNVLKHWAEELEQTTASSWVIFDNTTFGYATSNALDLRALIDSSLKPTSAATRSKIAEIKSSVAKSAAARSRAKESRDTRSIDKKATRKTAPKQKSKTKSKRPTPRARASSSGAGAGR